MFFRTIFTTILLGHLVWGCNVEFEPYEEIHDLRVLAIRFDPPEVVVGQQTQISGLVATPEDAPYQIHWQLCLYTLGPNALQACGPAAVAASAEGELFQLGFTPEIEQQFHPYCSPDAAMSLPDGAELPSCDASKIEATVRMVVQSGNQQRVAVRQLRMLRHTPTATDTNPTIVALEGPVLPDEGGENYQVTCRVDQQSLDHYLSETLSPEMETLHYSWFIRGGKLERQDGEIPEQVSFTPDNNQPVTLWVVVRDDRNGMVWQRLDVKKFTFYST